MRSFSKEAASCENKHPQEVCLMYISSDMGSIGNFAPVQNAIYYYYSQKYCQGTIFGGFASKVAKSTGEL